MEIESHVSAFTQSVRRVMHGNIFKDWTSKQCSVAVYFNVRSEKAAGQAISAPFIDVVPTIVRAAPKINNTNLDNLHVSSLNLAYQSIAFSLQSATVSFVQCRGYVSNMSSQGLLKGCHSLLEGGKRVLIHRVNFALYALGPCSVLLQTITLTAWNSH